MPFTLLKLADAYGIKVEYWDFQPPLEAVYWFSPGLPPVIGLANSLFENRRYFRCVLAEELGHHFTTVGEAVPKMFYRYGDRLDISKAEHRAMVWAAKYLMPADRLLGALSFGIVEQWELADYFEVTEDMVRFRMGLWDMRQICLAG
ncbi:MAG: ImmA/IrrE family metallo-endopeptidase [Clostridia bacterium]|nr:ImmA/IrrE family metallo-endopeptidase [Clostridia bacterium]